MREKTVKYGDDKEVIYSKNHWELLSNLRNKAKTIMETLQKTNINSYLHGSIARGDVHNKSDIDIVILSEIPSFRIELALSEKYEIINREIIQATPNHSIKGHIHLDENTTVTFPLVKFSEREYLFYKFGGIIEINEIKQNIRVAGVNKKLLLIKPTEKGHIEFPIINQEARANKILNLNPAIIQERIRVLSKRDKLGRTGIYLREQLNPEDTFENKLKELADHNPEIRHRIKR
ncbi:MAG: nucleotidyltransferase domain-containing protein [Candidatus Odinarchaeia archaeon]